MCTSVAHVEINSLNDIEFSSYEYRNIRMSREIIGQLDELARLGTIIRLSNGLAIVPGGDTLLTVLFKTTLPLDG